MVKYFLLDFYAWWNPSSNEMQPILDELAEEYEDHLEIETIDVNNDPQAEGLNAHFEITTIPTMIILEVEEGKDPKEWNQLIRMTGAKSKEYLQDVIDKLIWDGHLL